MSKQQITIKDLCPEEKKKIGELLKKLSTETEEKERLKQMLEDDKKLYESRINILKEQSICQQSQSNFNEFKAESFAQSFIGEKEKNNNPTAKDIQTLRVKFDELYETVKKAAKTNETILTKINNESIIEDKPEFALPKPIQQQQNNNNNAIEEDLIGGNILQTSMEKYEDENKSFISSNEDMFNGLISNSKKSKIGGGMPTLNIKKYFESDHHPINNNNSQSRIQSQTMQFNNNHQSTQNKYKEMLGRIREKSLEHNHCNTNTIKSNARYIQSQINKGNNYSIETTNDITNNNNIMTISKDIQLNFNSNHPKQNNNQGYIPQSITNISCISTNNNNNNNNNNISNTSIWEGNEYSNVLNFLQSNNIQNTKYSTMQNENHQISLSSFNTSKLEETANENLFNYIFNLESKTDQNNSLQTPSLQPTPFILSYNNNNNNDNHKTDIDNKNIFQQDNPTSNEMDEVEKEINSLHEKTSQSISQNKSVQNNSNPKLKPKQFKTKYANGCNRLYEDFHKINSKYI